MINLIPKVGHKVDDRPEFKIVRNYIIKNGFSVRNFDKNLSGLILEEDLGRDKVEPIPSYRPFNNRINGRAKGQDFIHELFHMASNINDTKNELGVMYINGLGESLNEGMTDYFTCDLLKSQESSYQIEMLYYDIICRIYIGKKQELMKSYFLGIPDVFYNQFGEDKKVILSSVLELDKYTRDSKNNTLLGLLKINNLYNIDHGIRFKTSYDFVPQDKIFEELTNAFSILINHCKEKNLCETQFIVDRFKETIKTIYIEDDVSQIINLLESKIIEGRKR